MVSIQFRLPQTETLTATASTETAATERRQWQNGTEERIRTDGN